MNKIKNKIINIYNRKEKIGKHLVDNNDFNFLDLLIVKASNHKDFLEAVILHYTNNYVLKNKIGIDFLYDLKKVNDNINFLIDDTFLKENKINYNQKKDLETEYTKTANHYGLKEFYYTLDSRLNSDENYNKALILLDKTKLELNKIQQELLFKDSYEVGNNTLSIQVNWQEQPDNNGYYNFLSNTICLKDEKTTFPLVHEYVHYIDKTTTCLLLTGKNSQELYEENIFTQSQLFKNFDMSIFSKIEVNNENNISADILKLNSLYSEQISQNTYMKNVFNQYDENKDYEAEFKNIILSYINDRKHLNKSELTKDLFNLLSSKATSFDTNTIYSDEEKNVISKVLSFNTFDLNINNAMNWSEELDYKVIKDYYYTTQKEMLARVIEQSINGSLETLSDRLTTPILSDNEKENFYEIIKSWHFISKEIKKSKNINSTIDKINNIRNEVKSNPNLINLFKIT